MHKTKTLSRGVITETSSKEKTEIVKKLKVKLKSYRNIKIHELVTRTDFEEILTMAARYEELSSTSESYISRLSMYRSIIKEGIKASQRVQLAQQRARLLKDMAEEKQKKVEAEFALVKSLAQRGDALYVKIFAIKKLVLKLEAEKEEVDMNFQKIVGNLSRVIEEASQSYEEYLVVLRKWKEEKAAEEFSRETIESAEAREDSVCLSYGLDLWFRAWSSGGFVLPGACSRELCGGLLISVHSQVIMCHSGNDTLELFWSYGWSGGVALRFLSPHLIKLWGFGGGGRWLSTLSGSRSRVSCGVVWVRSHGLVSWRQQSSTPFSERRPRRLRDPLRAAG
ncbi:hypothetical protein F2Q69_00003540 [Brassica cretica]|uniref:Uncharacterized protein n=1 Tax=Brassica cretica TaxID=69181 RepID=A0A8S9P0V3_BRACR|nr:hypothetical protein F2Q69_00003540 [Brassica cretica]